MSRFVYRMDFLSATREIHFYTKCLLNLPTYKPKKSSNCNQKIKCNKANCAGHIYWSQLTVYTQIYTGDHTIRAGSGGQTIGHLLLF